MQEQKLTSSRLLPLQQPEPAAVPVSFGLKGGMVAVMWSDGSLQQLSLASQSDLSTGCLELQVSHALQTGSAKRLAGLEAALGASRKRKADSTAAQSSDKRRRGLGGSLPGLVQVSDDLLAVAGWVEPSSGEVAAAERSRQLLLSVQDLQFGSCWASAVLDRPSSAVQPVQVHKLLLLLLLLILKSRTHTEP